MQENSPFADNTPSCFLKKSLFFPPKENKKAQYGYFKHVYALVCLYSMLPSGEEKGPCFKLTTSQWSLHLDNGHVSLVLLRFRNTPEEWGTCETSKGFFHTENNNAEEVTMSCGGQHTASHDIILSSGSPPKTNSLGCTLMEYF